MTELDEKYLYLPESFWDKHQLCEQLVAYIEELIINDDYQKLKYQTINFNDRDNLPKEGEHIFDFLERIGKIKERDEIIKSQIIHGLVIDTCYFLQEFLRCSKSMRLSVAFSLLRKPFVYNLIVFLRIIYEENFLFEFNNKEKFDSTYLKTEDKEELIKISLSKPNVIGLQEEHSELLIDLIFNRENPDSIINMSEKALHLSTTRNKNNLTGKQNLNFIFSTYSDNLKMWNYLYSKLPLLLLYLSGVIDYAVLPIVDLEDEKLNERLKRRIDIFNKNTR